MALVKRSELTDRSGPRPAQVEIPHAAEIQPNLPRRRGQDRARARQQLAAERIGAATEEVASGVAEASSAAEELRRALEEIASAAEEAAGASHESLQAIAQLNASFADAREHAETSRRRTEVLQNLLAETGAQIDASIAAIQANA